ncbi:MAG: hypothetical protein D6690_12725 [Nitrospirae bacterium]|nr:MAG: hypothetical protein D6690_12725 [Nitrospirota bacterium]
MRMSSLSSLRDPAKPISNLLFMANAYGFSKTVNILIITSLLTLVLCPPSRAQLTIVKNIGFGE